MILKEIFNDNILEMYEDIIDTVPWDKYKYNGSHIPRVSDIIKTMHDSEAYLKLANSMGFNKRSYDEMLSNAAMKGTLTHELIEKTIINKSPITNFNHISDISTRTAVINAYTSFMQWYKILEYGTKFKVLYTEKELICPYMGGTIDLLIEIDGKTYLVDYKTSNHMSNKYFIQLAAYDYMLQDFYNIKVDGWIVLLLSKRYTHFNEYMLRKDDEKHYDMCLTARETMMSLLYGYYNKLYLNKTYLDVFGDTII